MTLTTHAIVGSVIATLIPSHPVMAFSLAFGSHFLLDAIPHWDYSLASMERDEKNPINDDIILNKTFLKDFIKIGFDGLLGTTFSLIYFVLFGHFSFFLILAGVIGGMLPDALQFVYMKWRHEPLITLQKFHLWIHAKKDLNDQPFIGTMTQALVIFLVVFFFAR